MLHQARDGGSCDSTISVLWSDSVLITRQRTSVIQVKCDPNFLALLAHSFLAERAAALGAPRFRSFAFMSHDCCNLAMWLISARFSQRGVL